MPLTEEQARARAEAQVRAYCGWIIAPSTTETLVLDGDRSGLLLLPTLRLTALVALTVDGTTVDVADVEWSSIGVVRWPCGDTWVPSTSKLRGITVQFTHGYDEWPLDLAGVVDRLTTRATTDPGIYVQVGQVRTATGSDGLPVGGELTDLDRSVLDRYRLPPRP
jgi:hypothetical protein